MKSIYDMMRPGSRNQWKRRKKQLRNLGMKSGEWHTIPYESLNEWTMRDGMIVQNISGRPALYRVIMSRGKTSLMNLRTEQVKEMDNPRKYKWVRA